MSFFYAVYYNSNTRTHDAVTFKPVITTAPTNCNKCPPLTSGSSKQTGQIRIFACLGPDTRHWSSLFKRITDKHHDKFIFIPSLMNLIKIQSTNSSWLMGHFLHFSHAMSPYLDINEDATMSVSPITGLPCLFLVTLALFGHLNLFLCSAFLMTQKYIWSQCNVVVPGMNGTLQNFYVAESYISQ